MTKRNTSSIRNERLLYLVIWVLIALLPVILELWEGANNIGFNWKPVVRWWCGMLPLLAIFMIHNHILIPKFMKKGRTMWYCLIIVFILAAYGGLQHVAEHHFKKEFTEHKMPPRFKDEFKKGPPAWHPHAPGRPIGKPPRPFPYPLIFKIMLAMMTVGMNVAVSMAFTYHRDRDNKRELENGRLQEELKYLKQQISPHFLMNVLNDILELAEENIKEAQDMILELSYLMRYVLYDSEREMTTLSAESRFISSYVSLMKMRYINGLVKVRVNIQEDDPKDIHVPPLLFIPFVENAFKHGISYNRHTLIDITLSEIDGKILFSCVNTIPEAHQHKGNGGVGLTNVKRRLELIYGDDYSLHIDENAETHTVTLIIPSL